MADLITRLLLNTQQFDNNTGIPAKDTRLFQWCCQCLYKICGGTGRSLWSYRTATERT